MGKMPEAYLTKDILKTKRIFFFLIQWTHRNYFVPGTKCFTNANSFHPHNNFESEIPQLCPTFCNPWTVTRQAPLFMGFSRQEYWSGLSFPSPGDLLYPGIEPRSPALQALFTLWATREAHNNFMRSLLFTIYIRGNWGTEVR